MANSIEGVSNDTLESRIDLIRLELGYAQYMDHSKRRQIEEYADKKAVKEMLQENHTMLLHLCGIPSG